MRNIKVCVAVVFVAAVVMGVASQSYAYPPFVGKARKFGAKDCTFCHVEPLGGPPWNERGQWLIKEKERRRSEVIDVEWLAVYQRANAPGNSGDNTAGSSANSTEQELATLVNELAEAMKRRDATPFARVLADDFSEINAEGQVVGKAQVLAAVPRVSFETYAMSDLKVRAFGDAAITTFRLTSKGSLDGRDFSGEYIETTVWIKRDGRWLVVAAHATRVPAAKGG